MTTVKRESAILELLEKQDYVDNIELSNLLNCSVVTVRTTMRKLEQQGLLIRTHGGARSYRANLTLSIPAGNILKNQVEKRRIAKKAYQYINDRDTIMLDDSSNSFYLAQEIKANSDKYLIVITNSLAIACELSGCKMIEVMMIGGLLAGNPPASMGETATKTLQSFRANKAFIGVHGINPEVGITSIGNNQLEIKKLIFELAQEVYVLACSNKFGNSYLLVAAPLSKVHRIITDKGVLPKYKILTQKQTSLDVI